MHFIQDREKLHSFKIKLCLDCLLSRNGTKCRTVKNNVHCYRFVTCLLVVMVTASLYIATCTNCSLKLVKVTLVATVLHLANLSCTSVFQGALRTLSWIIVQQESKVLLYNIYFYVTAQTKWGHNTLHWLDDFTSSQLHVCNLDFLSLFFSFLLAASRKHLMI